MSAVNQSFSRFYPCTVIRHTSIIDDGASLFIHSPKEEYSTAENILHILRPDSKFSPLEAKLLDIALILHMEHGGGNNSTFYHPPGIFLRNRYILRYCGIVRFPKGPKHGGANIKVVRMFDDKESQSQGLDG